MPRDKGMTWQLECNGRLFDSKIQAIRESINSNSPIRFVTPDAYATFDWHSEPTDSFDKLCVTHAEQLRADHEELYLFYSGGCDSHFVLQTFLENKIKIDKIIMVKSGYKSADFEIDDYALPYVKKLDITYEVRCPDQKYYHNFYYGKDLTSRTQNDFHHHFRLNNHFENLNGSPNNRINIFGKEKPKLSHVDGKWYTYFMDVDVTNQPHQHNFYIDNPTIHAKQCHMLKSQIEKHKSTSEYNQITHFNENEDFWNRSLGRYNAGIFPAKALGREGFWNNKDQLAIQSAEPHLVSQWRKCNARLVDELGVQWFNQGDPALGTVGVFSDFYCISEKDTKTVDELYPNGFFL